MLRNKKEIVEDCKSLLLAYKGGKLGCSVMPEDSNPGFSGDDQELRLVYFTLPMSLNYQRDSYKLWESVLATYEDFNSNDIFSIKNSAIMSQDELKLKLLKHKIALQQNKHTQTWQTVSKTVYKNWGTLSKLFGHVDNDYLKLKDLVQVKYKTGFPYLSGPKIFNYWSFVMSTYGKIPMKSREFIDIAPDTHITKCSVRLGVITEKEMHTLTKENLSQRWREILSGTGINPIDMHPPLWFWSRNNFLYKF